MAPAQGRLRAARGLSLSAACLGLPVAAHAVAGGGLPASGPFLFGATLLAVACVALAGRRRSGAEIAAVVFATQPVLHVLLALSSHGTGSIVPTPVMLGTHVVAAAAVTVLLAGGERLVWSFAALADTVLLRTAQRLLSRPPTGAASIRKRRVEVAPSRPSIRGAAHAMQRRGPPVVACR